MTSATLLAEASGVDLTIAGNTVLSNVDLAVNEHEIVTLIGPNGSGKSTLVRLVLGLLEADRGQVFLRPGLRIGYMPQRLVIDDSLPLTVDRFLRLGGTASRRARMAALGETAVSRLADSPIQKISGGEMQRVLLARALLREPDLLVLDEPAQGVDMTGQAELFKLITGIRDRRGCGVLMVSHDLHLVMASTDSVVCLNHHVCCTGHPETVTRHPAYIELFGPLAAEGFAVYTHRHDHHHGPDGAVVHESRDPGGHA
ncbi:MAG: ATP-binding cassette domain-containing protein [Proteobacteria bacterium]|nr:ATP-binding cassette domain-containing protein [Pseudomonadota bacterium]